MVQVEIFLTRYIEMREYIKKTRKDVHKLGIFTFLKITFCSTLHDFVLLYPKKEVFCGFNVTKRKVVRLTAFSQFLSSRLYFSLPMK